MKYIITILIFALSSIMCGFKTLNEPTVYRDLGEYVYYTSDGSKIGVKAYITKSRNNTKLYSQYKNVFTLISVSTSKHNNTITETWLYNTRVFFNSVEISANQYPQGFTLYVKTTPTFINSWYTNDENIGKYYIKWGSSAYEPRI